MSRMILSPYMRYIGTISGRFPGRYTRPKTGIFSWSQYELSHLQNFVLRHIGGIAPRLSRDCPISRSALTFTHGEISQKFFAKFSQVAPHLTRRIRTFSQESAGIRQNPRNVTSRRNFSKKFFPNFFPKFWDPRALASIGDASIRDASKCALTYIARNFSKNFFQIFSQNFWLLGRLRQKCAISKDAFMLDREKFFAKFFSQIFWDF
jgi:hypothetical protein